MKRIFKNGGSLYRVCSNQKYNFNSILSASSEAEYLQIEEQRLETAANNLGPWRVRPGGLSVLYCF